MTVNRLVNQSYLDREVDLVDSLKIEAIQMKGRDMKYMPRDMVNRDPLFGEATLSEFKEFGVVEMYLVSIENFNGDGDLYSKFGLNMTDSATFEVSLTRFQQELAKFGLKKPRVGDLLYYDLDDALYEIRKVQRDPQFYALGKNYTHILKCSLFQFSHEKLPSDPDFDTFRDKTTVLDIASDNMAKTLGISADTFLDESKIITEEAGSVEAFDPSNPFGGQ